MANLVIVDAQGNQKFLKATGSGTDTDPYLVVHTDTDAIAALNTILTDIGSISDAAASLDAYGNFAPNTTIIQLLKLLAIASNETHQNTEQIDSILTVVGTMSDAPADPNNLVDAYGNQVSCTMISLLKGILKK